MPITRVKTYLNPKEHLDKWIAILTLVGLCWGGITFVDGRYVKADEYVNEIKALRASRDSLRQSVRLTLIVETGNLRKTIISDALFELDFKKRSTPKEWTALDDAKYQRYLREYAEVEQKLQAARANQDMSIYGSPQK